jgi:MazG family protein
MKLPRGDRPANATDEVRAEHGLRAGLEGLRDLMDRLLADDGCPWDREQTLESLRPYLLEETHEVLESMSDPNAHRKELGDLLFQVVFQSALRERQDQFDLDDVVDAIVDKMVRRHPHVFGDEREREMTPAQVEEAWSRIKAQERGDTGPRKPLAGVPATLPALARAWRLQDKASNVGFDWPDIQGALEKFHEEWAEFQAARESGDRAEIKEELGDLLFVLVRIGQKLGVEAEDALRGTNAKFERRFAHVMQRCHDEGLDPARAGLDRLDGFWDEAKRLEREAPA